MNCRPQASRGLFFFCCTAVSCFLAWAGRAEVPVASPRRALADLTLEELMNTPVTSVSKKETKLSESAAAVYVVTGDDARRAGANVIPEALRMVPGIDVGRINANEWAVSSRGFNNQYANKLLVLVDGRTIYTPSFSGVFWHSHDLMMEDLDRIEVIRGPGATLWGANAVNGVINIMTRNARDTQGWLASTVLGTDWQPLSSVRYGGQLGSNAHYRVYAQFLNHHEFERTTGEGMGDDWVSGRTGTRVDWQVTDRDQFTLQGDYSRARIGQTFHDVHLTPSLGSDAHHVNNWNYSANALTRWTRTLSSDTEFSLQLYYDTFRHDTAGTSEKRDTFDFDWKHRFPVGERHDVVWGLGYRYAPARFESAESVRFFPETTHEQLFNGFIQDEISIIPDKLRFTAGIKLEHNSYTQFEFQPSGRLLWTPTERQAVWGAVSRATRTPNRAEEGVRFDIMAFDLMGTPALVSVLPSSGIKSEELLAYEIGYRVEPARRLTFDLAAFYNVYDDLVTFAREETFVPEASPPPFHLLFPVRAQNLNKAVAYGAELIGKWQVTDFWRLTAGYTWYRLDAGRDEGIERTSPAHKAHLGSVVNITDELEFNSAVYFVDRTIHQSTFSSVAMDEYVRLDLGLNWRPTPWMELAVWGQNLLDSAHSEATSFHTTFLTEVPRSVFGKVTIRF